MANKNTFKPLSPFAKAFAIEYKGWMKGHDITLQMVADELGRTYPYVQERTSGKRALDTLDVDALASLTGTNGRDLMIELAKRSTEAIQKHEEKPTIDPSTLSEEEKHRRVMEKVRAGGFDLAANDNPDKYAEMEHEDEAA